jgi:diguanylate cyclase (GGDEF)-like protein
VEPLTAVVALATELQLPLTLDELLQRVLLRVGQLVGTRRASIRLFDQGRTRLFLGARLGEPVHEIPYEQQPGQGLLGWVAMHGRPLRTDDAEADPRFLPRPGQSETIGSFLGMPVIYQGHTIGVVSAVHAEKQHFSAEHEQILRLVAALCAPHLEVARLARLASLDPLTGVLTPDSLETVFPELDLGEPVQQMSLLLVDVDGFSVISDGLGQDVGDEILRTVARVLAGTLRIGDAVIRYSDDSFLLVVPGVGMASASRVAERARTAVAEAVVRVGDGHLPVTVSIGVAEQQPYESREQLIARAESALDSARQRGGNSVRVAMP